MTYRIPTLRQATADPEDIATRARLIQRLVDLRDELQIDFNTVAHWNEHVRHPHEAPIDPDPDGRWREMLNGLNAALVAEGITRVM